MLLWEQYNKSGSSQQKMKQKKWSKVEGQMWAQVTSSKGPGCSLKKYKIASCLDLLCFCVLSICLLFVMGSHGSVLQEVTAAKLEEVWAVSAFLEDQSKDDLWRWKSVGSRKPLGKAVEREIRWGLALQLGEVLKWYFFRSPFPITARSKDGPRVCAAMLKFSWLVSYAGLQFCLIQKGGKSQPPQYRTESIREM